MKKIVDKIVQKLWKKCGKNGTDKESGTRNLGCVKSDLPSQHPESYDKKPYLTKTMVRKSIVDDQFLLPNFLDCPVDFKAQKYLKLNLKLPYI